jgi:hypothetical protein
LHFRNTLWHNSINLNFLKGKNIMSKSPKMALAAAATALTMTAGVANDAKANILMFDAEVTGFFNLTSDPSEPAGFDLGETFSVDFSIDEVTNIGVADFETVNGDTFTENYTISYDNVGTTFLARVPEYSGFGVFFFDNDSGQNNLSLDDFLSDIQSNGGTQLAGFGFGSGPDNLTLGSAGSAVTVSGRDNQLAPVPTPGAIGSLFLGVGALVMMRRRQQASFKAV